MNLQWDTDSCFPSPSKCDNKCTDQQKSGWDWSDLISGQSVSSYDGFGLSGFSCSDRGSGLGKRGNVSQTVKHFGRDATYSNTETCRTNASRAASLSLAAHLLRSAVVVRRMLSPSPASVSTLNRIPMSLSTSACLMDPSVHSHPNVAQKAPMSPTTNVVVPPRSAGASPIPVTSKAVDSGYTLSDSTAAPALVPPLVSFPALLPPRLFQLSLLLPLLSPFPASL